MTNTTNQPAHAIRQHILLMLLYFAHTTNTTLKQMELQQKR